MARAARSARSSRPQVLVLVSSLACGDAAPPAAAPVQDAAVPIEAAVMPSWSGAAWTPAAEREAHLARELARDGSVVPAVGAGLDAWRAWARVGPSGAPEAFLRELAQGDPSPGLLAAVGLLEPLPAGPGEAVQPTGAWAVLERDLWTRLAVVEDAGQYAALAFSIARIGGRSSQVWWATELGAAHDEASAVAGFDALNILCARRHPLHPDALGPIAAAIDGERPAVRHAALGALGRCAAPSAESFSERAVWVERLDRVIRSEDAEAARLAWKALAALGERVLSVPEAILGSPVAPWLVEVEAVRALAGHDGARGALVDRLVALSPATIVGTRAVVAWIAVQSLRRAVDAEPALFDRLRPWRDALRAEATADDRHRVELAVVICELQVLSAIAGAPLSEVERCADGVAALPEHHGEALAIEALVATTREALGAERAAALLDRAKDHRPQIAAAALAALADVEHADVNAVLRDALVRADPGVQAAAAGAIAARAADRDRRDAAAVAALEALARTADDGHALEARISAIDGLGALARSAGEGVVGGDGIEPRPVMATRPGEAEAWLRRAVLPLAGDRNEAVRRAAWGALAGFDALQEEFAAAVPLRTEQAFAQGVEAALRAYLAHPVTGLRIHTTIGEIEIEFAGAPTPIAAANLVGLAATGTFDGLRFHRVVPGFVAQGGDPRGDGYGGPGWVVPCEWSDVRYERGTVGMALAGKDTGGSQFFIAQTRQPHLDGRFTVVGRVRAGLDVVDRLLPHDTIVRVEIIDGSHP